MKKLLTVAVIVAMLFTLASVSASAEGTTFWLTQYDQSDVEGAGVVFTETDAAGQWWHHFAFAPIKGTKDAYEIVAISNASQGTAEPIAIPEGGFVYACNMGNNWPQLSPTTTLRATAPPGSGTTIRSTSTLPTTSAKASIICGAKSRRGPSAASS